MSIIGDLDSRSIINYLFDNSETIHVILFTINIPRTSGYRKIRKMIELGMLVKNGFIIAEHTRREIPKYTVPFESWSFIINKSKKVLHFKLKENVGNETLETIENN